MPSDEAMTLAAQWDALKPSDPVKESTRADIEAAFKRAKPKYAKWENDRENDGHKRKKKT